MPMSNVGHAPAAGFSVYISTCGSPTAYRCECACACVQQLRLITLCFAVLCEQTCLAVCMWSAWSKEAKCETCARWIQHRPPARASCTTSNTFTGMEARSSFIPSAWSRYRPDWTAELPISGEALWDVSSDDLSLRGGTSKEVLRLTPAPR